MTEQLDEVLECRAQGWGGDGSIADEAQIARPERVAEPQAEIAVAGLARGFLEERAIGRKPKRNSGLTDSCGIDAGPPANQVDVAMLMQDMVRNTSRGGGEDARDCPLEARPHQSILAHFGGFGKRAEEKGDIIKNEKGPRKI